MFKVNIKDYNNNKYSTPCSTVSIVNFEHAIASWDIFLITIAINKTISVIFSKLKRENRFKTAISKEFLN